jgi:uncharacterized lipoprotein YddW (UPF0748 family)
MRYPFITAALLVSLLLGSGLVACDSTRDDTPRPSSARQQRPRPAPTITPLTGRRFAGIWVTRWDYQSAGDVVAIFENAAELGATDVFFQVRGQADAYYESDLEPWGEELFRGRPAAQSHPGFDPLTLACAEAHRRGVRIHAWINVMPIWKGKTPPRSRDHAFYRNTEWLLRDRTGAPQPLTDHYITANPMRDSFRAHVGNVVDDIVSRYPVDGLHLDYIRFVSDTLPEGRVYPGDDWSVREFRSATGLDAWQHPTAYRLHIREAITDVVREISTVVRDRRSRAIDLRGGVARSINREINLPAGLSDLAGPSTDRHGHSDDLHRLGVSIRDGPAVFAARAAGPEGRRRHRRV